jgi:hypothetical protein
MTQVSGSGSGSGFRSILFMFSIGRSMYIVHVHPCIFIPYLPEYSTKYKVGHLTLVRQSKHKYECPIQMFNNNTSLNTIKVQIALSLVVSKILA